VLRMFYYYYYYCYYISLNKLIFIYNVGHDGNRELIQIVVTIVKWTLVITGVCGLTHSCQATREDLKT